MLHHLSSSFDCSYIGSVIIALRLRPSVIRVRICVTHWLDQTSCRHSLSAHWKTSPFVLSCLPAERGQAVSPKSLCSSWLETQFKTLNPPAVLSSAGVEKYRREVHALAVFCHLDDVRALSGLYLSPTTVPAQVIIVRMYPSARSTPLLSSSPALYSECC